MLLVEKSLGSITIGGYKGKKTEYAFRIVDFYLIYDKSDSIYALLTLLLCQLLT